MSKVRCRACREYVPKEDAIRLGSFGHVCSDLCKITAREREQERRKNKRILQKSNDLTPEAKKKIKARDNFRCRWCGTRTKLHVHHIVYRSEGGTHDERNLITLCLVCHDRAHSDKRKYQPLLLEAARLHYEAGMLAIGVETVIRYLRKEQAPTRR